MRSKTEDDTMKNPRWPHQKPEMTGPETVFDKTEKYSYEAAKYEQAYNKKKSYKINWEQYANQLTIRDSMFGSENKDNLENIISEIILDIIKQELKEKK